MNPPSPDSFIFIHSSLDDYGLTPAQFRVLAHLARRQGRDRAFASVERMAQVCRLHPQTVRKALKFLEKSRLIRIQRRFGQTHLIHLRSGHEWAPPATPPSVSESTPATSIPGHPSASDAAKGSPLEGNPIKQSNAVGTGSLIPSGELEAIQQAAEHSIPESFARQEFLRLESTGWFNGSNIAVRKWSAHIRKRWEDHQAHSTSASARPKTRSHRPARTYNEADYHQDPSQL